MHSDHDKEEYRNLEKQIKEDLEMYRKQRDRSAGYVAYLEMCKYHLENDGLKAEFLKKDNAERIKAQVAYLGKRESYKLDLKIEVETGLKIKNNAKKPQSNN